MVLRVNCDFCLFLVFLHNVKLVTNNCHNDDNSLYLIRSTASKLVLDSSNKKVSIQHFDGYTPQLWHFKRGSRPGLFIIKNNGTGTVLDVDTADGNAVILAPENNNSLNQEWYLNSNGRIVNAGLNLNMDIIHARYVPGNPLTVRSDNGNAAQDFIVKEKKTCGP